jgi:hypothetical protein
MNVYLHDIRLCLEYIDRIEATIRLSQMMKQTRSIVRIEEGATLQTKFFSTKEFFPRIHPTVYS